VTTYVGVNRKEEGRVLTEALIEEAGFDSSTTGSVLIGNCAKGTPVLDESAEAVEEVFKKELPKAEIVSFAGQVEQAKNTSAWSSELANHPDAIAALGACGQDNVSILSATKSGGMNIAIGLFNPNEAELKAQQSGRVDASVSEQPWTQGYMTIKLLTEGARGTALPEGWINPGVLTITAENVDEFLKASTGGAAEAEFSKPYAEKALEQARSGENVKPIGAVTE
jgi:ABC-type sugar transport system substrate-binding protein